MQQVVNCMYITEGKILLLHKKRRNWWVAPGGKVEPFESISDTCLREYEEETGLIPVSPSLSSIFTVVLQDGSKKIESWMFYNFIAGKAMGTVNMNCSEGRLAWHDCDRLHTLPMAAGDRIIFANGLEKKKVVIGTVMYTPDYELLDINYNYY